MKCKQAHPNKLDAFCALSLLIDYKCFMEWKETLVNLHLVQGFGPINKKVCLWEWVQKAHFQLGEWERVSLGVLGRTGGAGGGAPAQQGGAV